MDFRELPECLRGRSDTANSQEAPAPVRFRPGARVALPTRPWPPRPAAWAAREFKHALTIVMCSLFPLPRSGEVREDKFSHVFSEIVTRATVQPCKTDPRCLIESNSRSSSQREERGQLAFVELPVFGTDTWREKLQAVAQYSVLELLYRSHVGVAFAKDGSAISADLRHAFSGCFRAARVCRVDPTCRRREMQRATWKCLFVRFARDTLIHVHLAACDCGLLHMSSPFRRRHYRGPSKRVFMRSVADFRLIRVPPAHCSSCVDNRHYVSVRHAELRRRMKPGFLSMW